MSYRNALSTGYSSTLFDNLALRRGAESVVKVLKRLEREGHDFHVAVTGKSGIAMAFAVAMIHNVRIVTIRKTSETSHGGKIEGAGELKKFVILDDFVESGETVRRVNDALHGFIRSRDGEPIECMGFIEYTRLDVSYVRDSVLLNDGTSAFNLK